MVIALRRNQKRNVKIYTTYCQYQISLVRINLPCEFYKNEYSHLQPSVIVSRQKERESLAQPPATKTSLFAPPERISGRTVHISRNYIFQAFFFISLSTSKREYRERGDGSRSTASYEAAFFESIFSSRPPVARQQNTSRYELQSRGKLSLIRRIRLSCR